MANTAGLTEFSAATAETTDFAVPENPVAGYSAKEILRYYPPVTTPAMKSEGGG